MTTSVAPRARRSRQEGVRRRRGVPPGSSLLRVSCCCSYSWCCPSFSRSCVVYRSAPGDGEELGADFVALRNYVRLFETDSFWAALRNSFYFVAVVTPLQSALALLLALLVNQKLAGARFSAPSISCRSRRRWRCRGDLVAALRARPGRHQPLGRPAELRRSAHRTGCATALVMPAVMLLSVYLAGRWLPDAGLSRRSAVDTLDLYEAARLDGATVKQQFLYIRRCPMLKNTTIFGFSITTTIYAFQLTRRRKSSPAAARRPPSIHSVRWSC